MFSGILTALLCTPAIAEAQNNRGKAAQARAEKREKARKAKRDKARRNRRGEVAADAPDAPPPSAPKAEQALPANAAAPDPKPAPENPTGKDASRPNPPAASELDQADVRKEGDTEVKMMEFSGLDIEGQLKTPQMLYFLNRLRAEFGRPRLPHRSFMPELQAGTQDKATR